MKQTDQTTKKPCTGLLAQVAKLAGVSQGTVSRVFNNSTLIPQETRIRILCAARELGFRPRVGIRTKQIALITEPPEKSVMGGYVNTLTQYICHALSRSNAGITMITEDRIDNLSMNWYDGMIGIAWQPRTIDLLKKFHKIPIVWLSDEYREFFHSIYIDAEKTGRLAGGYFAEKGHRRLAVIQDPDYTGRARTNGMKEALQDAGCNDFSVLAIENTVPLHLAVKQILDAGCTGIWVTGEDMKVLEVNWLLQELVGKRIPQDISLMGFENPGISEFLCPSLTTIASPLREIAEKAVELVLRDDLTSLERVEMSVHLIERNSVATIH